MNCSTVLAGLSEAKEAWNWLAVVRYLLLVSLVFLCAGAVATNDADRTRIFYLPRYGYRRWCRVVMLRSGGAVLPVIAAGCILGIAFGAIPWEALASAAVLALNMVLLAWVQALLILWKGANAGAVCLFAQQFLALGLSEYLPGNWKLLLPGNWGMLGRSSIIVEDGFSLPLAMAVELAVMAALWLCFWRIVRRMKRSV
ncbi:MAG: hypothetical protein LUE61_12005 [Clostridiales bacterium]|nr:hypothetical protein [Clostridiales bacterium]MCD8161840.1 hypothetical protein [Clostridiales bacterium]